LLLTINIETKIGKDFYINGKKENFEFIYITSYNNFFYSKDMNKKYIYYEEFIIPVIHNASPEKFVENPLFLFPQLIILLSGS